MNPGNDMPCPVKNHYPLATEVGSVLRTAGVFPVVLVVSDSVDWWKAKLTSDCGFSD